MILCCGEALIDMIPTPTTSGREGFVPHAGGAVFNTAIALGRQGVPTGLLTGLSTDLFGEQLGQTLSESGVDTSLSVRSDRHTTLAFVRLTNGQASYTFYDENSAGLMVSQDDLPDLPDGIDALFFGGISLACEPGASSYEGFALKHSQRHTVMIDPNIRPSFIEDEGRYRTRMDRMLSAADIVKVSDEDLDWLLPAPNGLGGKVAALLEKGPSLIIVTKGAEGATAFTAKGQEITVAGEKVSVVDTVGAGDTFNAGVLAKLANLNRLSKPAIRDLSDDDLQAALSHGARTAAITVSRAGADAPWAGEFEGSRDANPLT